MAENAIEIQEKPILFSGAMVRAVIEGRKTQTRRAVKPMRGFEHNNICKVGMPYAADPWAIWWHGAETDRVGCLQECPYGKPGDRLWVRETFARCACDSCRSIWPAKTPHGILGYQATYGGPSMMVFKPSIHMPRWASRLTLEIVSVKVERVQEISRNDAIAEGMTCDQFSDVWEQINGKRGFGWEKNPWVWAIQFRVLAAGERRA